MNRIRLTASAVAATSLGSLGLAGVGASAAHAVAVPNTAFSGEGFDICQAPTDAQMDDWYAHSPYHAVGVYIGGSSYLCKTSTSPSGGYTPQWVQHQAAAGWAMWALYSGKQGPDLIAPGADPVALGAADAQDAATQAATLGFGPGTVVYVDMENYTQAATGQAVVKYLTSFAQTLAQQPGGFKTGLYGISRDHNAGPSAIGDAAADPTLSGLLAAVDIAGSTAPQPNFHATTNDPWVPANLWARHQRIHQYFLDSTETYGSTTLTVDANQLDLAPSSHLAADPTQRAVRWAGNDRIGTAVAVSQRLWPNTTGNPKDYFAPGDRRPLARSAVLSRSDDFSDALGGSALAAHVGGPLLLTSTVGLSSATAYELQRTLAPGSTVYLLGGSRALSPAIDGVVRGLGFVPQRLEGPDRYSTAVAIAQEMAKDMKDATGAPAVQRVLLATANKFPDALAAGTAAGATPDTVLLLTNDTAMPAATAGYLAQISGAATGPNSASIYPVGGAANTAAATLSLNPNLKPGLVGGDRYATAYLVARQFFGRTGTPHEVGLATGLNWADALSGGAALGTLDGPLLLTAPNALPAATQQFLADQAASGSVEQGIVLGGTSAVSDAVLNAF